MTEEEMQQERRRKTDEQKEILEAVIKEWLAEQFAVFGKWTFRGILILLFSLFLHGFITIKADDLKIIMERAAQ